MPQLMPFLWFNSFFMVNLILLTFMILYLYKNMENMKSEMINSKIIDNFNMLW